MQVRIGRRLTLFVLGGMATLLLASGLASCKKVVPTPTPITPLQKLINSDTSLSLYHRLLLQANETGLLADKSVTLLIPGNAALRALGYSQTYIDSISATLADHLVRYHFIPSRVSIPVADSGAYTPYMTLAGTPVYGMSDGMQIWFNGTKASPDTSSVGLAIVYRLDAPLAPGYDSLLHFTGDDSSLTFLTEAIRRTGLDSLIRSGAHTLLAPVNSAFRNAGYDSLPAIDSADSTSLSNLIKFHVVKGTFFTNSLASQSSLPTLQGSPVSVSLKNGLLQFSGSGNPVPADLLNGNQTVGASLVVHRIDRLLGP
ncbi:MAG: fasciclin domain-containing protein [Bacteroidota bacterium]|nr:fasciclin domain-containing protein [Bacteroidota bacterium]MDP4258530.1 fasciclin domain-containing protein [Bacteroidota bacterium]